MRNLRPEYQTGSPGGSVSAGLSGLFRRCGGGTGVARADWMYLRHAAGSTEKGIREFWPRLVLRQGDEVWLPAQVLRVRSCGQRLPRCPPSPAGRYVPDGR